MSFFACQSKELKSVFFVLGAPNVAITNQLEEFYKHNGENMKIVFCSDYDTMNEDQRQTNGKPSIAEDIGGIPTNCRAHAEPSTNEYRSSLLTIENFRIAQKETSGALVSMFEFSRNKKVPLYLASIPRADRPLNVTIDKVPDPLTQKILDSVVYPSYSNKKDPFKVYLERYSMHHASYLIDLITVVIAMMGDDVWYKRQVKVSIGEGNYGRHVNSKGEPVTLWDRQISDVQYFKMENQPGGYLPITVNVFDFEKEGVMEQLKEKLVQVANEIDKPRKHFKNSFVFGDDLLNDVDDIPAKYVVRRYTQALVVPAYINYTGCYEYG